MKTYDTTSTPATEKQDKLRRLVAVRQAVVPVLEKLEGRNLFSATVESFTLIDADTDQPIMTLANGATINLTTLPRDLNIRANVIGGEAASVEFNLDGSISSDLTGPHYALAGEFDGDYQDWTPATGTHTLSASAVDADPDALDAPGLTIEFRVVDRAEAPDGFTATATSPGQVQLEWIDKATDETHFIIDRSTDGVHFHRIGSAAADSTGYVDDHHIMPSTTYYYRVKAINRTLNSRWVGAVVTTLAVPRPDAPSGVTATPNGNTLELTWSDNSSGETHFIIDRSIDGENFNRLGSVPTDVTTFTDTWAEAGVTYTYRVKAVTTTLNSPWSAPASGMVEGEQVPPTQPEQRPGTPSDLLVEAMSSNELLVTWQDNADNEMHFLVDRSIDGINWSRAASLPAGSSRFTDSGLQQNTKYYYRVKAVGATLTSAWSATQSAVTEEVAPPVSDVAVTSFTLINADTNQPIMTLANGGTIDFAAIGTRNVNVRANVSGAVGSVKFVYDGATFRTESGNPFAMAGDYAGTFHAWTPEVGAHTLKAIAYTGADASGTLGRTHQVSFTVVEGEVTAPTAPAAPTSLSAAAASSTSVKLTWSDASSNEAGFRIERSTDGVNFTQVASVGVNVRSYTNTVLEPSTKYFFRVRAHNAAGNSGYTNVAEATTSPASTNPTPTPGTFPSASTTGPTNRSILVERGSFTVTEAGAVVENFIVRNGGQIVIAANNVTLRNFVIENPQTTGAAIKIANSDITGTVIEDGEIFGGNATNGVAGSNYTARRLHMYNLLSDCFRVRVNVTIEGCYLHDFSQGDGAHGDGVQMYPTDGGNIRIIGNYIDARGGNAALFQVNGGWHVEGNYFAGGNYTIQCGGETGNKFINNTFARDSKYGPIRVGSGDRDLLTWTGNVWADTGATIEL